MDVRTVVEKILRSLCHSVTNRAYAEHKQTQCESGGKSQKSPLPYEYCARPCWSCFLRHRVHNISIRSETVMTWITSTKRSYSTSSTCRNGFGVNMPALLNSTSSRPNRRSPFSRRLRRWPARRYRQHARRHACLSGRSRARPPRPWHDHDH